jgi:hypothetical protein
MYVATSILSASCPWLPGYSGPEIIVSAKQDLMLPNILKIITCFETLPFCGKVLQNVRTERNYLASIIPQSGWMYNAGCMRKTGKERIDR